jgi:hypothetical protein
MSCGKTLASSIFRIEGPSQVQEVLFGGREDLLCGHHVFKEAPALF